MAALCLDADAGLLDDDKAAARILTLLYRSVPANKHPTADASGFPAGLEAAPLSDPSLEKLKRREGRFQFGTLGRGNHFLEFQADAENRLWVMVHSGSRAMGPAIMEHHLERALKSPSNLSYLDRESPAGSAYLADASWAGLYAAANRLAMLTAVTQRLSAEFGVAADWSSLIHSDHNHVRRERHFGLDFWVHRKGAQSASVDEPGIIPGSMGTSSFHVTGRGCKVSLNSSSHGAGRKLSRADARREVSERALHRQLSHVWFDHRKAGALRDEAPSAYKDIHAVMRAQRELTRITRELRPLLSYKGA
jgi:tRNA-splicing ligase RtcB